MLNISTTEGIVAGRLAQVTKEVTFPSSCKSNWTSTCKNQSAVLQDNEPPTLGYSFTPTNQTVAVDMIPIPPTVSALDNDPCFEGVVNYTEFRSNSSCPNEFSLKRTWVSEDASNNVATESVTITVEDDMPPSTTAKTYCAEITQHLVTKSKKMKKNNMMQKWVRLHLPIVAQDVCGSIEPKYCDPTVRLNFLSCTSSHGVTSKDNNGASDCFFLNNTEELFMYVDTKSTELTKKAKSEKSHRKYTVRVEYIDVCNNSVDTTLTYIIPNQYHKLAPPSCTDGVLEFSFDEAFDLCVSNKSGKYGKSDKSGKSGKSGKSRK